MKSKMKNTKSWKSTLNAVLKKHNTVSATGAKTVSYATRSSRSEILDQGFKELRQLGFKLPDVKSFKERHMLALGYMWESNGLSSSTIQNRISVFRVFSEWIGKKGMIREPHYYVKNPDSIKRSYITRTDKTWSGKGQLLSDKLASLQERDKFVAIQLELQRAFGLRMKEASLLKPHQADKINYLSVNWGTKGGRDRVIPIETDYQREVITRAKSLVSDTKNSITPKNFNFKQWRNHYYYICRETGIDRKNGITSHGLRHERLNEIYQHITGQPSTVKGGPNTVNPNIDEIARQEIAEIAGHNRSSISGAYIGN